MHGTCHWVKSHRHSYLSPFLLSVYGKAQDTRMQNYRHCVWEGGWLAGWLCNVFVFQNLYHTILHIFENILLILVSKDLYKLHILKVKSRENEEFCFLVINLKSTLPLVSPTCHTSVSSKYVVAEQIFLPPKVCDYAPNQILYLSYRGWHQQTLEKSNVMWRCKHNTGQQRMGWLA